MSRTSDFRSGGMPDPPKPTEHEARHALGFRPFGQLDLEFQREQLAEKLRTEQAAYLADLINFHEHVCSALTHGDGMWRQRYPGMDEAQLASTAINSLFDAIHMARDNVIQLKEDVAYHSEERAHWLNEYTNLKAREWHPWRTLKRMMKTWFTGPTGAVGIPGPPGPPGPQGMTGTCLCRKHHEEGPMGQEWK